MNAPSTSTLELIAHRVRAHSRLAARWMQRLWAQGQSSLDQGLAITADEVARLLQDPAAADRARDGFLLEDPDAAPLAEAAGATDRALASDPDWAALVAAFELERPEADLLCLLLALEFDPRLQRVIAYLQDDAQAIAPTTAFAASLFRNGASVPLPVDGLQRWHLAAPLDGASPWRAATAWQIDPAVALSLAAGTWRDPRVAHAVALLAPEPGRLPPVAYPQALQALQAWTGRGEISLMGPEGGGRQTLAMQYAAGSDRPLLAIDTRSLLAVSVPSEEALVAALRMACACRALPYWRDAEVISAADWNLLRRLAPLMLRGDRRAPATASVVLELPKLSQAQRLTVWAHHSAAPAPPILATQQLTPGEIALIARAGPAGHDAVRAALRRAAPVHRDLLTLLPCHYTWDDLVVPPDLLAQLREFETQVRLRWEVYDDWGFARLTHLGHGIAALFGGPSGTGKTMAAQVLARSLGLDLYRVDLAGVVNKYVGETEKRLRDVFDACERAGALLFFDEADALFGNRMQVKDSHDRFANIEIDYLLQRIERFDGIAILATNRKNDLDAAFLRRLRFVVDFLMPAPAERLLLWRRALLPAAPTGEAILDSMDWEFLARRLDMTGAQIKASALGAAFLAKSEGVAIGMRHVMAAAQREMAKHGATLRVSLREALR
ncbi:MAG: ATP-binding protein [Steroidobacteraceae bacterium]